MEFFKIRKDIPFMRHALVFNVLSILMFSLAAGALTFKGLNLGVEFTGGTVMEVGYSQSADLVNIRESLESGGMSEAIVQSFGDSRTVLIRLPTKPEVTGAKLSDQVFLLLKQDDPQLELRRVD
jgi:preprotein translocase subunit SecF